MGFRLRVGLCGTPWRPILRMPACGRLPSIPKPASAFFSLFLTAYPVPLLQVAA